MYKSVILFFVLVFPFACNNREGREDSDSPAQESTKVVGYVVPEDSIPQPLKVPLDKSRLIRVRVATQRNEILIPVKNKSAATGQIYRFRKSICTPGMDSFTKPLVVKAKHHSFYPGLPETTEAKNPVSKFPDEQSLRSFTEQQGLKHEGIRCVTQDGSGNIWFGGAGGLCRFDGRNFTSYTENVGLCNNEVIALHIDKKGVIWVGTSDGLTKYDGVHFTNYTKAEGLISNHIWSIGEDREGNIWLGTFEGGVSKFDGEYFTHYTPKTGLVDNIITAICQDKSGNLWFGSWNGLSKFDGNTFTNYTDSGKQETFFSAIKADNDGNIWMGGKYGLFKHDGKRFTRFSLEDGLAGTQVISLRVLSGRHLLVGTSGGVNEFDGVYFSRYSDIVARNIFEDRDRNLWFGTQSGLVLKHTETEIKVVADSLSGHFMISSLLCDRNGYIWRGSYGGGVVRYGPDSRMHYGEKEGLGSNSVHTIFEDSKGNIWIGTNKGVTKYDGEYFTTYNTGAGLSNDIVISIMEDSKGNLWFGTDDGGVSVFDGEYFTHLNQKNGLSDLAVFSMCEDNSGKIWISNYGGGVWMYDGRKFTHFGRKEGFTNHIVYNIVMDRQKHLWFGTNIGLVRYNDGVFKWFSTKEGLSNDFVKSLIMDKSGNLWIGTHSGLNRMDGKKMGENSVLAGIGSPDDDEAIKRNMMFWKLREEDGFPEDGCNRDAICEDRNGKIWIGSKDRLFVLTPKGQDINKVIPNTQLTGIRLFNENIDWLGLPSGKDSSLMLGNGVSINHVRYDSCSKWYNIPCGLSLPFDNNYITFNFIGLTQKRPSEVRYRYQLEGYEHRWNSITMKNEAFYANLPPGHYTFKLKSMNSSGYWSTTYSYPFTIRPPWWKTWWAYSLYIMTMIVAIWAYIRWRVSTLERRQRILEQTVKDRTAEVVAGKKLSDDLLLNILPSEVAEELKQYGTAEARQFDEVTVLFTDFKDFTRISEKLNARDLVAEIHTCYKEFDNIITRYNIEKIKTIGDSYMCAGGLPVVSKSHAVDVVNAAFEIQAFIFRHSEQMKREGKPNFEIRIGIHTGPVVAGIVGIKKFAYDIWGDTVNIASRMESGGEAGRINISGRTYELVKDHFKCSYRGKIDAKNKGEIDMYFVEKQ